MINEEELKLARAAQCRTERHRVHRRNRQDRAAAGNTWRGRFARRRATRPVAARRRQHGEHEARRREDRSHSVHRFRRISHVEAVRSDSRAAGSLSDPGRARCAQGRGLHSHPHRARRIAVHVNTQLCSKPKACSSNSPRAACDASRRWPSSQRTHREHRRTSTAHRARAPARRRFRSKPPTAPAHALVDADTSTSTSASS